MTTVAVKVTRKGQITLPVELRREFGIEEGDIVYVHKGERGIEITTPDDWVARTAGIFREYAEKLPPLEPHEIGERAAQYWTKDAMDSVELTENSKR